MLDKSVIVPTPPLQEDGSITSLLHSAIAKGDSEAIKTLAEIWERLEAKRAEREFISSLLAFKSECPAINKTDAGVHNSKFAPLGKIAAAIDPILTKNGLTYSFDTTLEEGKVSAVCILHHIAGHSTRTTFRAPIDPAPRMTDTHATASATSLAERYALQLALGLVTRAMDDDGASLAQGEKITPEQVEELYHLVIEAEADTPAFWKYCGVQRVEELPAGKYEAVKQALRARIVRREKEGEKK